MTTPEAIAAPSVADRELIGTVALVTGASSGIGEATARALAARGATVGLVARRRERLQAVAAGIETAGGKAVIQVADVTDRDAACAAVDGVVAALGRLDILVNCAGLLLIGPVLGAPLAEWERMLAANVQGLLYCTHAALPHLVAAARSAPRKITDIVNVSSISGRKVVDNSAVYTLTKMGIGGFSEGIRAELAQQSVRVFLVEPGPTQTELLTHLSPEALARHLQHLAAAPPLERLQPKDVAEAVLFIVTRSRGVAINEIMLRPTVSPF